jgi:hypothetical protein
MSADTSWRPFGVGAEEFDQAPERDGVRVLNLQMGAGKQENRSGRWMGSALAGLGVLALAAAAVSFTAQYRLVFAAKHLAPIAALEAGIPDVGSMIFACLGIALALHGKRAIRARALNVACVGLSLGMNALAAAPGWRDMAIWVMPSAVYALASDTLIGVIRAYALAKQRELRDLADDEATPLAVIGGLALWLLRLSLAPRSTLGGFRTWVVETCPTAPGRRALPATPDVAALPAASDTPGSAAITTTEPAKPAEPAPAPRTRRRRPRGESKTARFIALVKNRHGDFAGIDPAKVSRICTDLAPEVGLNVGAARAALLPRVRAAQAGGAS